MANRCIPAFPIHSRASCGCHSNEKQRVPLGDGSPESRTKHISRGKTQTEPEQDDKSSAGSVGIDDAPLSCLVSVRILMPHAFRPAAPGLACNFRCAGGTHISWLPVDSGLRTQDSGWTGDGSVTAEAQEQSSQIRTALSSQCSWNFSGSFLDSDDWQSRM